MQEKSDDAPFEVYEYSFDELKRLLAEKSSGSKPANDNKINFIEEKFHSDYFEGYFSASCIAAKTIVVENRYIDHDYLEDYAHYYVRCFSRYKRSCVRLHFFSTPFSEDDLKEHLSTNDDSVINRDKLNDAYIGFMVIKPLPETIIGRTCLKTYDDDNGRRFFPIKRKYKANLFGLRLSVESLAYQEQDSVVAVCATSALWSVFQGTGWEYHHQILSPVEITKAATGRSTPETRTLTKSGLNPAQLSAAIRAVNLEPYIIPAVTSQIVSRNVYAYLQAKIPLILGMTLVDTSKKSGETNVIGRHAVAVTGFSVGHPNTSPVFIEDGARKFLLKSSRIDKIYVHDDGIGAFARMELDDVAINVTNGNMISATLKSISSSWKGDDQIIGSVRAIPDLLIVPLYHKIRIPFEAILSTVYKFDGFIETLRTKNELPISGQLQWDIHLSTVNDIKGELLGSSEISDEFRMEVLSENMPKFLWVATAYDSGQPVLGLVFDATDIEQGQTFIRAIEYDENLSVVLRAVTKESNSRTQYQNKPEWKIMDWFSKQPI